jgi:hypothetical protein
MSDEHVLDENHYNDALFLGGLRTFAARCSPAMRSRAASTNAFWNSCKLLVDRRDLLLVLFGSPLDL